ncbi:MAG: methylmalonyl-CoA mutase family protein [Arachnia sp.]
MTDEAMQAAELSFAADFDSPSTHDWEREVLKVLNRGRPEGKELTIDKAYQRLTTTTVDGLVIKPMYTREDGVEQLGYPGVAPFTRGATVRNGDMDSGWQIAQLHEDPDPAVTRQAILTDLERGCSGLWLRIDPDAIRAQDLATVLADVHLDLAAIHVSSRTDPIAAARALIDLYSSAQSDPASVSGSLGIDPIGFAAQHGTTPDMSQVGQALTMAAEYPGVRPLVVDSTVFHNAGAGDVAELAAAIGAGTEYLRAAVDQGHFVDEAAAGILFRVSATTEQFLTISRLRALRTMWTRVCEVSGVAPAHQGAVQHAVTSLRQLSRDDAYVNVLRGTISCFAAAAGDAEIQTVLPLDTAIGLPNELSRRIARNTQVILAEESNVGRVNDTAGGAWYVESMTRQMAEKAWEVFAADDERGYAALVADGTVAAQLAELNAERATLLATRKLPLTGVSMFPDMHETPLPRAPRPEAAGLAGITPVRDAQVFEDLRDRSQAAAAAGKAPKVLLACLGTRRDFGAREGFTSNLYHVGGIDTVLAEGTEPADFARQLTEAGTTVAVLCSSAKVYAAHALDVAAALKQAGATQVRLAGQLKEIGAPDEAGVIDGNVFDGMNVVELLSTTLDTLEA